MRSSPPRRRSCSPSCESPSGAGCFPAAGPVGAGRAVPRAPEGIALLPAESPSGPGCFPAAGPVGAGRAVPRAPEGIALFPACGGEGHVRVAGARHLGGDGVEEGQFLVRQGDAGRLRVLLHPGRPAGAGDGDDREAVDGPLLVDPGQGDLAEGGSVGPGDGADRVQQGRVGRRVVAREAGHPAAEVAGGEVLARVGEGTGQEAAAERRVRDQGHAQFPRGRHHLRLDVPAEQRPLRLHGRDRVHTVRGAQLVAGDLAQAQLPDLALAHQFRHGADGLLDRHVHIAPVHVVEADHVGLQAPQARLDGLADVGRVVADDPPVRVVRRDRQGELGGDDHLVAVRLEERGEEALVVAVAVRVRRVVQRDAEFQGALQGRPGGVRVSGAVGETHAHAAETLDAHLGAVPAQCRRADPAVRHHVLSDARARPASA